MHSCGTTQLDEFDRHVTTKRRGGSFTPAIYYTIVIAILFYGVNRNRNRKMGAQPFLNITFPATTVAPAQSCRVMVVLLCACINKKGV